MFVDVCLWMYDPPSIMVANSAHRQLNGEEMEFPLLQDFDIFS